MMIKAAKNNKLNRRKGAALIVVLGVVMVVTLVAFAYLSRSDGELQYGRNMLLRTGTDLLAESGLEHARGLILNPQEIADEYWTGSTFQQVESGDSYYDVSVEPNITASGDTKYCDYDVTCSAYRLVNGQRTAQSNLNGLLRLDECIAYWSGSGSSRQLSGRTTVSGDIYSDGSLEIFGTVNGDAFCDNLSGTVSGQEYPASQLSVDWPDVNITQFYSEYVFSSVFSPLSGPETGTYLKCTGDLTITDDVRITGMLVVEGDLQITGTNNLLTAVKNAPALFVAGDITIDPDAEINIEGLAVVDGAVYVNVGCEDVNVIGGLFAGDGIIERAKDISSNNFDAIVRSEPDWQPAGGQIAGAAEFDGYDDKLEEYSIDSSLNGLSAITVTCWVKSNVTNQDRGIFFTKAPSEGDEELGLRYDKDGASGHADSGIKASIRTTSGYSQIETDSHTQTTSWQHLALVWESGQYLKLYINGLEHTPKYLTPSSFPLTGTVTGVQKFMLGCGTKGRYWDGLIDDVRIYSRALDSGEIQLVKSGLSTTGLLAHWQLDEDGQREVVITAAPAKTALWCFSTTGDRERWAQAGTAFYKMIKRY